MGRMTWKILAKRGQAVKDIRTLTHGLLKGYRTPAGFLNPKSDVSHLMTMKGVRGRKR
jgi:hypothetical protein